MNGWREWTGGPRPDTGDKMVQIQLRCQTHAFAKRSPLIDPKKRRWSHDGGPGDIVALKEE